MPANLSREISTEIRLAASAADRDGTAALNTLVFGGALMIASSVALVAVGGVAGVFLWAFVWFLGLASVAAWLAPHMSAVRQWRRDQSARQRVLLATARERAVDLLLSDDVSAETQRAAAHLLAEAAPLEQPPSTRGSRPRGEEPT
ncbi:MAG: hypothetical protein WBO84_10295 [Acidimicrobiia bacterium]